MDVADSPTIQHMQKNSPPPPTFVDDVIDIQTMVKSIEKEINKEEYKLKINNSQVKILPANSDSYRRITKLLKTLNANFHTYQLLPTKLLKTLNANFHTYQLKQERPFRVVLRNIHHSANIRHRISKNSLSLFFINLK